MLTQEQLATAAAAVFVDHQSDVPDKLWVDTYEDAAFVRAAWGTGLTCIRIDRLEALQAWLSTTYGKPFVAVAYWHDHDWTEVDAWAAALKRVR